MHYQDRHSSQVVVDLPACNLREDISSNAQNTGIYRHDGQSHDQEKGLARVICSIWEWAISSLPGQICDRTGMRFSRGALLQVQDWYSILFSWTKELNSQNSKPIASEMYRLLQTLHL
jgi:hypothetical protein